ncbi:indole-3-glycerol phosphate synthase [Micromonospora arborensis]|uniref:indole-3-glycerol-phosphate synthase n=1 Tax=Micromonospora arborensis TaxID=2116518 RepID=A0A318NB46_9ACTN|nr:indole-3-glycerol-phosphate synthase [Micromonospora arborensis]PYC64817.1 indole-3-glycerol phosphate synthase [Micromonospora arborensis]
MDATFMDALRQADRPVVMELKRRDGAGADLFGGRSLPRIVAAYERAGAPCLSVVTGHWFGGTEDMLREVRSLTGLPLLQKDFITRRRDLDRAVRLGASAVLLTARLLARASLDMLVTGALERGLTPFVEVATPADVRAVPRAVDCVIAVSNGDIASRERAPADLNRSVRLLSEVSAAGTPCPVSASGIADPADAARLLRLGYRGLLIGSELLRAGDELPVWLAEFDRLRQAA